jgi:hypothetical protein
MTTPNTNAYVVEWMNDVPAGSAVACYSVTDVENYFGVDSVEASEAKTFFAQHPGSTMYFGRDPIACSSAVADGERVVMVAYRRGAGRWRSVAINKPVRDRRGASGDSPRAGSDPAGRFRFRITTRTV